MVLRLASSAAAAIFWPWVRWLSCSILGGVLHRRGRVVKGVERGVGNPLPRTKTLEKLVQFTHGGRGRGTDNLTRQGGGPTGRAACHGECVEADFRWGRRRNGRQLLG